MRIERDSSVWCGRVIDLSGVTPPFDGERMLDAINEASDELRVVCEKPGDLHAHVGWIRPEMTLQRSTALAAAARSRGWSAPQDEEYNQLQDRIEELSVPDTDTAAARKRLAETTDEIERQRERVARLQGEVKAFREHPEQQTPEPYRALERAMQKLSELETEHAAAEQRLERARERQRQRHDRHDERLALEDRAANLARAARKHLCDRLHGEFTRTIESLPGPDDDPVAVALTITRLGTIHAPVVLECDRFDNAQAAADWLNTPVVSL